MPIDQPHEADANLLIPDDLRALLCQYCLAKQTGTFALNISEGKITTADIRAHVRSKASARR